MRARAGIDVGRDLVSPHAEAFVNVAVDVVRRGHAPVQSVCVMQRDEEGPK